MKTHARVVIIGGGVMGVGLLYHLALEGWTDVVLLEKGELTSGSTWHAAGQCPHFNSSLNMTKVHVYGTQLYPRLEALTGHAVSWHGCGGLRLACTDEEVHWLQYVHGISRLAGYECHILGPSEIKAVHPFLDVTGVKAAFHTLHDGHVAPADITMAMAAGARALGAEIHRRTRATNVQRLPSGEWQITTDQGTIIAEHVVNSAGSYADVVGSWTGHLVPMANMLHHYLITEPVQELIDHAPELPVVRDPYSHAYLREETNGILIGPYETATAHVCWDGKPPAWDFESELVAPELDRLMPWLEKAAERFPLFGQAGVKSVISGAITHTPDGTYLSGPAPGAPNYWMHCAASIGICQGGGAGKYLAQWMVHGQAEINMREFDPRRFGNWATQEVTETVAIADYHHMYYCYKPGEQHKVGRDLRKSSLHDRLKSAGAPHGIQLFGTYAMNALRMEKSYRGWGSELTAEIDMFEASMQRFIRLDKPDFIGREASLSRQQRGPRMTLVTLAVDATDSDCMGNEPVYHNDTLAGLTTSGAYGHALNQSLAFAYVAPELAIPGTKLEIALFQHRHTAEVIADSPYDPANERLRA